VNQLREDQEPVELYSLEMVQLSGRQNYKYQCRYLRVNQNWCHFAQRVKM
jgi:hypothetical protein